MKLVASCCNCGFIFGRSADGTQTELRCSKCGAEVEYIVENDSVTVRMIRLSAKQQMKQLKKYAPVQKVSSTSCVKSSGG